MITWQLIHFGWSLWYSTPGHLIWFAFCFWCCECTRLKWRRPPSRTTLIFKQNSRPIQFVEVTVMKWWTEKLYSASVFFSESIDGRSHVSFKSKSEKMTKLIHVVALWNMLQKPPFWFTLFHLPRKSAVGTTYFQFENRWYYQPYHLNATLIVQMIAWRLNAPGVKFEWFWDAVPSDWSRNALFWRAIQAHFQIRK